MNTKPAPIKLESLTYVSGAFHAAYAAAEAEGWTPRGTVTIAPLDGPNTTHVFLSDAADVATIEEIIAAADADEPMLKRQRARDARVARELRKTLARHAH